MRRSNAFLAIGPLPFGLIVSVGLLTGCPDETTPNDDDVGDTADDTTGDGESSTDDATTDETADTTDATTETGGGVCGDGNVDPGEDCDDGNTEDGDGCSATCTFSSCSLQWNWMETIAGGTPGGYGTVVDPSGVVYTVGEDEAGEGWAASWNADGSLAWEQSYGDVFMGELVLGDDGDLYVVGSMDNGMDDDIRFARISSADGSEVWSQTVDSTLGDDYGNSIAWAPDGSIVVAGRVRVGDGDDDVWVSKRSVDDGSETWVSTWSGMGDGMFSTERTGPVTVTSDGSIWVGAREHVDFDTQEATLIKFDEAGTELDSWQPQGGGSHQHESWQLTNDGTNVYYVIVQFSVPYHLWLYELDGSGAEQWSKTELDLLDMNKAEGTDYQIDGLDVDADGNLLVVGEFSNEDISEGLQWGEAWVAKLDGDGNFVCRGSHMVDDGDIIPPSLDIYSGGASSGGFAVTGVLLDTPDNSLWTGFFRP